VVWKGDKVVQTSSESASEPPHHGTTHHTHAHHATEWTPTAYGTATVRDAVNSTLTQGPSIYSN
jgi:hypothetical protein